MLPEVKRPQLAADALLTTGLGRGSDAHTANETTLSIPTKLLGTKRKGQNKTHQDPHDKPTQ